MSVSYESLINKCQKSIKKHRDEVFLPNMKLIDEAMKRLRVCKNCNRSRETGVYLNKDKISCLKHKDSFVVEKSVFKNYTCDRWQGIDTQK